MKEKDEIIKIDEVPEKHLKRYGRPAIDKRIVALEIGDCIVITGSRSEWQKTAHRAHTYGKRNGKKFKSAWAGWRSERAEDREIQGHSTAGMDTEAKGYVWRVK